jgi:AcrR family transcriptional regulator
MVRPRRVDDDELLARIVRALEQRADLTPWSLADIAPAAGIGPAGLIKRFGSKAGLLHTLTRRWIELIPQGPLPEGMEAAEELSEYVRREFGAGSAAGAVYALSEVLSELQDPELVALLAEGWRRQAAWLAELLAAMNLPRLFDAEAGGTLLLDALHGSLFRSAVSLGPASPLTTLDRFLEMWR